MKSAIGRETRTPGCDNKSQGSQRSGKLSNQENPIDNSVSLEESALTDEQNHMKTPRSMR